MDSHLRSIAKAVSWRVVGVAFTTGVLWIATGKPALAVSVGFTEAIVKVGMFYLHERLWTRVPLGRSKTPEYQI